MIAFKLIYEIEAKLNENKSVSDFRVIYSINGGINVIILSEITDEISDIINVEDYKNYNIDFEVIDSTQKDIDYFYKNIFENKEQIQLGSRRRISNLLDRSIIKKCNDVKTVTFYSYKGGVGRSTTLASCASYLANHYGKKILILDLDLEAPGFTNYFLEEPNQVVHHKGFVEYILDSELTNEIDISKYFWETGKNYSGEGNIYIMPAGNLSNNGEKKRDQYLEGLARIDLQSTSKMRSKFDTLIKRITSELDIDLLFIDSRTGFNDIFGIAAFMFSDIVIGLFSDNIQTKPGLELFIEYCLNDSTKTIPIIINSIISKRSNYRIFENDIEEYLNSNFDGDKSIKLFPLSRYDTLEYIGTSREDKEDYIDLIKNKRFPDFNDIFEYINKLSDENTDNTTALGSFETKTCISKSISPKTNNDHIKVKSDKLLDEILRLNITDAKKRINNQEDQTLYYTQNELKKRIKELLLEGWPSLYAEESTKDSIRKNIYYRKSMEDIFNENKFIMLGNKGTGKTYLYEALKDNEIKQEIQKRAQKKDRFEIIHIIDEKNDKYLDVSQSNVYQDKIDEELYFHRFWIVYIWNSIMLEAEQKLEYQSNLSFQPIVNNLVTRKRFDNLIINDAKFSEIEEDLFNLDKHLRTIRHKKKLIIIFDGLDLIIRPIDWSKRILPLINYWRKHSFSNIIPKLFLRSDLLEKLDNITNVKELKSRSVNIEWKQDEMFGFFFKLLFANAKNEFLKYLCFTRALSTDRICQIEKKINTSIDHIPLEKYYLEPLVEAVFGRYADKANSARYGESYTWFYRNLKNANDTLSLRPFIDLIQISLNDSIQENNDKTQYPILPSIFWADQHPRKNAVENHFKDIASEKGNEDLNPILDYIRYKEGGLDSLPLEISKKQMIELLNDIIREKDLSKNVDELISLLKVNGIIKDVFRSNSQHKYSFALLYKYYLGLKGKVRIIK